MRAHRIDREQWVVRWVGDLDGWMGGWMDGWICMLLRGERGDGRELMSFDGLGGGGGLLVRRLI